VNVSRGALIDEAALVEAVVAGQMGGLGLEVYSVEPLARSGHPMSALFGRDNVILFPHLTFFTREAMRRLEDDTLARCFEILNGRPVIVRSFDPRLRAQTSGVSFG
ncbi:C-terminal binding protein, partial [Mesorhizobium sp. M7A.F.Ca.US.006.01.1.1]|uniref:NAD(P)-dependent oxidoreductase n=1 Tax=Mesorhizobium sp. M7A.F.Ca.US.006.01.1.1 TaxID=2496707 RepID=UPI000FD1D11B